MVAWEAVGAVGSIAAAATAAWAAYQSRSSAEEANRAANTLAHIERDRRHAELCPRLQISCAPPGEADYHGVLVLRVFLVGPHALGQLDKLTLTIRDDHHRRGDGRLLTPDPPKNKAFRAYRRLSIREKRLPTWENGV